MAQEYTGEEKRSDINADLREEINKFEENNDCEHKILRWMLDLIRFVKTKTKIKELEISKILLQFFQKKIIDSNLVTGYLNYINTCWLAAGSNKKCKAILRSGFFLLFFDLFVFIPIFISMTHQTAIIMTIKIISPLG